MKRFFAMQEEWFSSAKNGSLHGIMPGSQMRKRFNSRKNDSQIRQTVLYKKEWFSLLERLDL